MRLSLSEFDYDLPEELIAQHPVEPRSASRLLHASPGSLDDRMFTDLPKLVRPGDLMVFNDTRVIKARLFGEKATGGKIEILVERVTGTNEALAHLRASHAPRPGSRLRIAQSADATVIERHDDLYRLSFDYAEGVYALLERYGSVPLPPYITHQADSADEARYQTLYARVPGAVAAPTAGLHFDESMFSALRARGIAFAHVTLHVGAGTFQPVRVENLDEHRMHAERYEISTEVVDAISRTRARGGSIIAVGTTSVRALESAARAPGTVTAGQGDTRLFITPGYEFRIVDRLVTNFHLPKSTLLMLVSAFAGSDAMRRAYAHAVAQRYRFFSYGDAMLIDRA